MKRYIVRFLSGGYTEIEGLSLVGALAVLSVDRQNDIKSIELKEETI